MISSMSMRQACQVYGDLIEALYGNASHGHEAEIYAYRLVGSSPTAENDNQSELGRAARIDMALDASQALTDLLMLFLQEYEDALVKIDGERYRGGTVKPFDHRVHVSIRRKKALRVR